VEQEAVGVVAFGGGEGIAAFLRQVGFDVQLEVSEVDGFAFDGLSS
jgi:hypothetical protein